MTPVPNATEAQRFGEICRYIDDHSDQPLSLDELAALAAMSKFHFARRFKAVVGVTPKQYAAQRRFKQFKSLLKSGSAVDASVYDAGYGSASRAYENAARNLGMTPAQYRRAGLGVEISHATLDTPAGPLMIGATDRGICFAQFGDSEPALLRRLRAEYPNARILAMEKPPHPQFAAWVAEIRRLVDGLATADALPLDVRATAFQMRVWRHLQSIPFGGVASYREVAAAIGRPGAARAVAAACARNPVAIVVPCHRVVGSDGGLRGYGGGLWRKRRLLALERPRRASR
jgi:AraC family transcriptional regulator, regulatory protein of adaptative response / methylated-DNA-[protein]-cysteine methyltransferase